jgi:heptosyltransferase-2
VIGKREINKIVVRCPNWVGDLVMCTPALRSLWHHFPDATISVIVKPSLRNVIENLPFFDNIIEYDAKAQNRGIAQYVAFIRSLRQRNFDLGIALTNSFSSALLLFLASIPIRVGYDRDARGWLLTHKKKPLRERGKIIPVNKVEMDLGLCSFVGCTDMDTKTELATSAAAEMWAENFFASRGIQGHDFITVIIPGASFGSSKCWKTENFAIVADTLIKEYGAHALIVPGPGEVAIARKIEKEMMEAPVALGDEVLPLDHLMAVIRRCSLLITNDTGPRHFGVAFHKPVIVIMGPTDSRHTDCNLEKTVVIREEVECAPCHLRECPTDHRCMTKITPEKVLDIAMELIGKYGLTKVESAV